MELTETSIRDFLKILASEAPAPGGGSVSALNGAMGSALSAMVARLTLGREKYKDKELIMKEILEKAEELMDLLAAKVDEDTKAYNRVAEVFKMPKETEEQKAERKKAMQEALKHAALVPFSVMELCVDALHLFEKAVGNFNESAASDLGVGALCLKAALCGAWLNVKINLGSIADEAFVKEFENRGKKLVELGTAMADSIYQKVLESL
ncbi:MAG: cyclodeaminase/cyclohydrolase family protein [Bacillota bacterium]|nr:MAG: sugar ABC transporter substrate-binding protein [Bacillota bacterium]